MWSDFGELIALALGIAISPMPVLGVILMLMAPRGMSAGAGFAFGWIGGVGLAVSIFSLLSSLLPARGSEGPDTAFGLTPVIVGAALVAVGVIQIWRRARGQADDDAAELPRWLSAVDKLTVTRSVVLGFSYAFLRPKNLVITIAAGLVIGRAEPGVAGTAIALGVFTVIASVTIAAPPLAYALGGEQVKATLVRLRVWLLANLALITGMTLILIGIALVVLGFVSL
ncbi:hypothetical protein GCM10022381_00310 [Leifsonia kafniensis]|uniref:GAP family protein n=1 Tax=Leifsonia kafniensis TaxID=475957 RepID=A0ABP7K0E8_9MICO